MRDLALASYDGDGRMKSPGNVWKVEIIRVYRFSGELRSGNRPRQYRVLARSTTSRRSRRRRAIFTCDNFRERAQHTRGRERKRKREIGFRNAGAPAPVAPRPFPFPSPCDLAGPRDRAATHPAASIPRACRERSSSACSPRHPVLVLVRAAHHRRDACRNNSTRLLRAIRRAAR